MVMSLWASVFTGMLLIMFLAMLELVRHHRVQAEQNDLFGEIWLLPGTETAAPLDPSEVDNYEHGPPVAGAGTTVEEAPGS